MPIKKMDESHGVCGVHLCGQCALPNFIFGLLFLVAGLGLWSGAPVWFNGWTLVGLYLGLWGLMSMMMGKK